MDKEKSSLEKFKKHYLNLQKKYSLPSFKDMNEDFQIEKASDEQTELLLKEIKKIMGDKFSNYHRFVEALINPSNSPLFVFSMLKAMGEKEKFNLTEIYKKLTKIEIDMIETDLKYSDEKEADFIKNSYETWQEIKKDLLDITDKIKNKWNNKNGNNKSYLG